MGLGGSRVGGCCLDFALCLVGMSCTLFSYALGQLQCCFRAFGGFKAPRGAVGLPPAWLGTVLQLRLQTQAFGDFRAAFSLSLSLALLPARPFASPLPPPLCLSPPSDRTLVGPNAMQAKHRNAKRSLVLVNPRRIMRTITLNPTGGPW